MAGMVEELQEPLFQQIVKGIETKLPKPLQRDYQAIVVAGMKVLFSQETHGLMLKKIEEAKQSGDVVQGVVKGITELLQLLHQESGGAMNAGAAVPAGATLMCHVFDFIEHQEAGTQFTKEMIAQATQLLAQSVLQAFGVSEEQLAQGADYNHQQSGGQPQAPVEAPAAAPAGAV